MCWGKVGGEGRVGVEAYFVLVGGGGGSGGGQGFDGFYAGDARGDEVVEVVGRENGTHDCGCNMRCMKRGCCWCEFWVILVAEYNGSEISRFTQWWGEVLGKPEVKSRWIYGKSEDDCGKGQFKK